MSNGYPGRPPEQNAVTRTGHPILVHLSQRDFSRLDYLRKQQQTTISDMVRFLINNAYLGDQEETKKLLGIKENE